MRKVQSIAAAVLVAAALPAMSVVASAQSDRPVGGAAATAGGGGARVGGGVVSGGATVGTGGAMVRGDTSGAFRGGVATQTTVAPQTTWTGRTTWNNNWNGGTWDGGWRHRHHNRFGLGVTFGAYDPYYYDGYGPYAYYDDYPYDGGVVVGATVAPAGDEIGYCQRRYRSYDLRTRTFLGKDGLRHPCP